MAMFKEGCFVRVTDAVVASMCDTNHVQYGQHAFRVDRVLRLEHVGCSRSMCSDQSGRIGWFPNSVLAAFDVDTFHPFI